MGESTTNSNRAARAWVMYFDGSLKLRVRVQGYS
jgi:hypothetical protein